MNKVYLSLGSNQGKSYENLIQSIKLIEQVKEINLVNKSKIYITKPMYNQNQNYFLNMVVEIGTSLNPFLLLRKLKNIERKLGKSINEKKNQPRKIDIDMLDFNNEIINSNTLTLPHPGIIERAFVLKPWTDIAPAFKLPTEKKSIASLISKLILNEEIIKLYKIKV